MRLTLLSLISLGTTGGKGLVRGLAIARVLVLCGLAIAPVLVLTGLRPGLEMGMGLVIGVEVAGLWGEMG